MQAEEGLALGTSSGTNVAGAMEVAKRLGPGHTVVTVLCDLGSRYASKLYNVEFLRSKKLPPPPWMLPPSSPAEIAYADAIQYSRTKAIIDDLS